MRRIAYHGIEPMHDRLQKISVRVTDWVGTPSSVIVHSVFFAASFGFVYFGFPLNDVLLVLTTVVSLEAIYLAIFIQMTVNRHTEHLEEVGEDIEDIQENMEDLGEDVEELSGDVEEISEDIEAIQKEHGEGETEDEKARAMLENIQTALHKLINDVDAIKSRTHRNHHDAGTPESGAAADPTAAEAIPGEPDRGPNYFRKVMDFFSPKGKPNGAPSPHESEEPHQDTGASAPSL